MYFDNKFPEALNLLVFVLTEEQQGAGLYSSAEELFRAEKTSPNSTCYISEFYVQAEGWTAAFTCDGVILIFLHVVCALEFVHESRHNTVNQLLKWKVKFIIPEPQNRLLWLYKFTSYSLVWALTLDPRTSAPFPPTYLQVKAPKENSRQKNKHKNLKHCINNVVKPIWKKIYLM